MALSRKEMEMLSHSIERAEEKIEAFKRDQARGWELFTRLWKIKESSIIQWYVNGKPGWVTLSRVLFIIEKRYERFISMLEKNRRGEDNAIHQIKAAISWYLYLWYGISMNPYNFGSRPNEQALRKAYLDKKTARRNHRS